MPVTASREDRVVGQFSFVVGAMTRTFRYGGAVRGGALRYELAAVADALGPDRL
jgi:hypothetical protein